MFQTEAEQCVAGQIANPSPAITCSTSTVIMNQADADAQLFSTLCEIDKHNYLYLFERCKICNVNARQLRYFEKDHIRELIPKTNLGILAEFEYLINEWKVKKGFSKPINSKVMHPISSERPKITVNASTMTTLIATCSKLTNTESSVELTAAALNTDIITSNDLQKALRYDNDSQSSSNNISLRSCFECNIKTGHVYLLKTIIPTVLARCQQKYKTNRGLLTEVERRLLSSSIIDYFISHKIPVKANIIENLAEQIVEQFPTESKRAWYERRNHKGGGRLFVKLYNSHRIKDSAGKCKKRKPDECASSSTELTYEEECLPEVDKEAENIQKWLKCNKCEDMNEVLEMWKASQNYRCGQLGRIKQGCEQHVLEMFDNWPAYKWTDGCLLLSLDFDYLLPTSTAVFRQRWPIFKTNIVTLMEVELKENTSVELFKQFKMTRSTLDEDSSAATLLHLLHAITKPSRCFITSKGIRRFCITDAQNAVMRLVMHAAEIEPYNEAYPSIFVIGNCMLNVEECYVAYRSTRYKLKFIDAFATCMHIYRLFKLDVPLAAVNFWRFIRGYLFDINEENEATYAVMDNIVKYLQTRCANA